MHSADQPSPAQFLAEQVASVLLDRATPSPIAHQAELLNAIIDRIPVMITVYEPGTRVLRLNPEFERVVGWSNEDAAGVSLMEECYPDPELRRRAAQFMESCCDGWMDLRMRTRDGRFIETSWANIRLSDHTQVGIGIDITERKRAQEAVASRAREQAALYEFTDRLVRAASLEQVYQAALDAIAAALDCPRSSILLFDDASVMRFVAWRGLSEAYRRAVEGHCPWDSTEANPRPLCIANVETADLADALKTVVRSEGIGALAFIPLVADGRLIGKFMLYYDAPHALGSDEVELALAISRQLAFGIERESGEKRRRDAEQRVRALLDELRETDRRKDEFLATLAHELRNPLAPIRNSMEIIKRSGTNTELFEQARDTVDRQMEHLVRMVDDLLDVSRISRNKLELRTERITLAEVVRSAVETSRPVIEASAQHLQVSLPSDPVPLLADRVRLAQVFSNLLNNAAKYSEPGGRITLEASIEAGQALVSVRDQGVGIPPHALKRIFDMFVQVESSLDRSQGGLGIGLTLVQRLVQMHGGSVQARSDGPGTGSEFVIRLPIAPGARGLAPQMPPFPVKTGQHPSEPPRRRVLVVDDNRDSANSMTRLLNLMGYDAQAAYDGAAAVAMVGSFCPDVALLDIGMPHLNGYDAARQIRRQWQRDDLTLIAMTGWGQEDDRRRTHEAGFDHHLTKPVDLDKLSELLAQT